MGFYTRNTLKIVPNVFSLTSMLKVHIKKIFSSISQHKHLQIYSHSRLSASKILQAGRYET